MRLVDTYLYPVFVGILGSGHAVDSTYLFSFLRLVRLDPDLVIILRSSKTMLYVALKHHTIDEPLMIDLFGSILCLWLLILSCFDEVSLKAWMCRLNSPERKARFGAFGPGIMKQGSLR